VAWDVGHDGHAARTCSDNTGSASDLARGESAARAGFWRAGTRPRASAGDRGSVA